VSPILDEPADRFEMLGARMDAAAKRNNAAKAAVEARAQLFTPSAIRDFDTIVLPDCH
jgi:hypothetical protein